MSESERPASDPGTTSPTADPPDGGGGTGGAATPQTKTDPFEDYYGGIPIDPPDNSGSGGGW